MRRILLLGLGIFVALMVVFAVNSLKAQCVDSMIIGDAIACPGTQGVVIPVYGRVCGLDTLNLDGVVFCMVWDTTYAQMVEIEYDVSDPDYQSFHDVFPSPNNFTPVIDPSGWATVGIVFSFTGTPDVPPGHYRMFDLILDVKDTAPFGPCSLLVTDGTGFPPKDNAFVYGWTDVFIGDNKKDGVLTVAQRAYGSIEGKVVNDATDYPFGQVRISAGGRFTHTMGNGSYILDSLLAGETYDVIAEGPACVPNTVKDVLIKPDSAVTVDFRITCLDTVWVPDKFSCHIGWDCRIPVYGKFTGAMVDGQLQDLDGLVFGLRFDPRLEIDSVVYHTSDPLLPCLCDSVPVPASFVPVIDNTECWLTVGLVFSYQGDIDVAPGRYHLFDLALRAPDDSGYYWLQIVDDAGIPPKANDFVYKYRDVFPVHKVTRDSVWCPVTELDREELLPLKFFLAQNYPNPFNPHTTIKYDLPNDAKVRLQIFNLLGEEVRTLVSEKQKSGHHKISWDGRNDRGKNLSSGVYFLRLEADGSVCTKQMLLLK